MKEIYHKILDILEEFPELYNRRMTYGILAPLDTEEKALQMLEYLKENKDNKLLMREDYLLEKSLEIMYGN